MLDTELIATSARPRRRLWLWSALIAGAGFLIAGSWLGYEWYQDRDLQSAIVEADRLDPGWRLADLEAARAEVPDEENAALQVLAAKKLLPAGWFPRPVAGILSLEDELTSLSPEIPLSREQAQRLRGELTKAAPALAAARPLADMSRGRYILKWSPDAVSMRMDHLQEARELAQLLRLSAIEEAHEGDMDAAIASCRAILSTGRSIGDEPFAISQLVRLSCLRFTIRSLERTLAQGQSSERGLASLQRWLEGETKWPMLQVFARAERANIHQILETFEAEQVDRASFGMRSRTGSYKIDNLLDRGKARAIHAAYLRFLNECVEISKLPPEEQVERFQQLNMKEPENVPELLAGLTRDSGFRIMARGFHYSLAFMRCGIAAVAVERFRLAHGHWPDRLEDLVPAYLSKLPIDPFDGQPLRFRRLKDGVIIYTIGEEQTDDGGVRVRIKAGTPDRDVGFQLWDAERRHQSAPKMK